MKPLKILGIIALVLALVVFVLNLLGPKDYRVERSITINAPDALVFDYLKYLEKTNLWSPWAEKDPNMKVMYEGADGTVGATSSWEGNEAVGKGSQEITAIKDMERVDSKLKFVAPREDEADAYFIMEKEGDANKVTWGITGVNPFPGNIMMLFMDLDAMIGKDFEKGLANLKALAEADKNGKKYRGYTINTMEVPEMHFVGVKETVGMDKIAEFFGASFGKTMGALQAKKLEPAGMPSGLYYTWDEEKKISELAAAIPMKEAVDLGKGFESFDVAAGKALQIDYYGAYDGSAEAHYAMDDYMKENGLKARYPMIEEYVTDPGMELDTAKWLTKITYLVE